MFWTFDPKLILALGVTLFVYVRGWSKLRRNRAEQFGARQITCFCSGIAALFIALASSLDPLAQLYLSAHMVQHMLLMMVAPPLILLGAPTLPMLRGLPTRVLHDGLGPFLAYRPLAAFFGALTHPAVGWLAMAITLIAWHIPGPFQLALQSTGWHRFEHACFFVAALLFWWPVVSPYPSQRRWPAWTIPIYLLTADLLNTALAAILTFSESVVYPHYTGANALRDQTAAGVIMWVPGSMAYLVPALVITIKLLSPKLESRPMLRTIPLPVRQEKLDLLRVPLLGRTLRTRASRIVFQTLLLLIAIAVVIDGFFGSRNSSINLAGVVPWTYGRAIAIVALLAVGNLFCHACPFTLARKLGRRLGITPHDWPRRLGNKWIAIGILVLLFAANESLGIWNRPALTAGLIIGYFVMAFLVDAFFRTGSFCKYICPIGQFSFVTSTMSPLEVKARDLNICATCTTHDCVQSCEMGLNVPRKVGNFDCTFCLDCVRVCPHDNIGLQLIVPGTIGRLSRRFDVAFLALMLVIAAFTTTFAMTQPLPRESMTITFACALVVAPAILLTAPFTSRDRLIRFALAMIPLGAAMWAAHLVMHLLARWRVESDSILILQTLLLNAGLLFTLYLSWRVARELRTRAMPAAWMCLAILLYCAGIWLFIQPMQMRNV